MKYKENVRQKLDQLGHLLMRLSYEMGRTSLDKQDETLTMIKTKLAEVKSTVELEDDNDWR
jgi:hypothetical protein